MEEDEEDKWERYRMEVILKFMGIFKFVDISNG